MSSRLLAVFTAALALLVSAPAALAAPANVTVRVEGASATLLERTAIRTTTTAVNKDGMPGHTCSGTSAAGALEIATGGNWGGAWFSAFGYSVERILGETHAFPEPDFFSLWINNREAGEGICGATSELQEGDDVLFFVARCEFNGSACANAPVRPLGLTAPALVSPGAAFEVRVVAYSGSGTSAPVAGATVVGADASATTNAAGVATLTIATDGPRMLKATRPGNARSAGERVCASSGPACGVPAGSIAVAPAAGAPAAACATNGRDGRCGTQDSTAPAAVLTGIREGRRFTRSGAPRRLQARVDPDPSGLKAVKLRLSRTDRGRVTYFSGRAERFKRNRKGVLNAAGGFPFTVGDREQVDYLLPTRLPRGRYVLDVFAVDKRDNRDDTRRRGANRIVFHVG